MTLFWNLMEVAATIGAGVAVVCVGLLLWALIRLAIWLAVGE